MKLATFIAPGADHPQAGEVRGDEIVAFTHRHRPRPPRVRRPHARRPAPRYALDRRHAAGADPAPAGDLLHRPQLRRPHRRARLREAREAARLPQAAALAASPPGGPVKTPKATQALDYEVELVLVMGPDNDDRRLRGRQRRLRARPAALRGAVVARQGLRHVLPLGPVDHDRGRDPTRPTCASRPTSTASCARTAARSDLIFKPRRARRLHRRGLHARARRDHPHRHAERRRRGVRAAAATCSRATPSDARSRASGPSSTRISLDACG